jgi:hypothetical protein
VDIRASKQGLIGKMMLIGISAPFEVTLFTVGDLILTAKVSEKRSQVWLIQVERTFVIFSGGKLKACTLSIIEVLLAGGGRVSTRNAYTII